MELCSIFKLQQEVTFIVTRSWIQDIEVPRVQLETVLPEITMTFLRSQLNTTLKVSNNLVQTFFWKLVFNFFTADQNMIT